MRNHCWEPITGTRAADLGLLSPGAHPTNHNVLENVAGLSVPRGAPCARLHTRITRLCGIIDRCVANARVYPHPPPKKKTKKGVAANRQPLVVHHCPYTCVYKCICTRMELTGSTFYHRASNMTVVLPTNTLNTGSHASRLVYYGE